MSGKFVGSNFVIQGQCTNDIEQKQYGLNNGDDQVQGQENGCLDSKVDGSAYRARTLGLLWDNQ